MKLAIEVEREDDGRWIAEVPSLPGVLAYGATETEARAKAQALALEVGPRMLARIAKHTGLTQDDM
jgi:predicted RNase H-like HicB family nuclease